METSNAFFFWKNRMLIKPRITVRRSKDPSIEEYFAIIWRNGRIVHSTEYYLEKADARAEAKEWIEANWKRIDVFLYDADPNCLHELDEKCFNGIKCKKCRGWFCS